MRDEGERPRPSDRLRGPLLVLATAALLGLTGPAGARAETFRGYAQVQYQSQDQRGGLGTDVEWWQKSVHLDYGTRLRKDYDLTFQGEWNDLSYVGRSDRQINPRGSVRIAHRDFGAYASYRPLRVTDALGVTTRQRETTIDGYFRRRGLPQVQGTYLRRRQSAVGLAPGATGITRSLNARQDIGPLSLHASWTDQSRFTDLDESKKINQTNLIGGGDWRWARGRSVANASLELQGSRLRSTGGPTSRTGARTANVGASHRLSRVLDAGLTYGYRHTSTGQAPTRNLDDHDGVLMITARPKPAITLSTGGGLRTTRDAERQQIERYLVGVAGVQGPIRPGWRGNASVSRSYNWLPGRTARPVDAALVNTQMKLARGLDVNGQAQVTAARANTTLADTSGARAEVTSQVGYGLTATPLRQVAFGFARSEYRSGESLFEPGARSRSDNWNARWIPARSVDLSGSISRSHGLGTREPTLTTRQATLRWTPMATLQWSGSYSRSDRRQFNAITQTVSGREVWGFRLLASVARDWRAQVSVNDVDPGQPTHVRQWDATLTRNVGR